MIGNDIIDLKLALLQSNWQRKGYLDKIFTDLEQHLIINSNDLDRQVWQLWSRKEAVYKLLLQKGIQKGYFPKKIKCLDNNLENGEVIFDNCIYYTKTLLSVNYIHSIAVLNKVNLNNVKYITWDANCFKVNTIPFLKVQHGAINISKSHHGRFEQTVCLNF